MCASAVDGLSLNGAVDSGSGDVEQLSELSCGMCPRAVHFHPVALLGHR